MQLDPDLERLVRRIAGDQGRTVQAVIADALHDYVVRVEARSAFVAEAEAAWDEYRATGLHITGAEADAWLKRWGGTADKAPPTCHD